jgi:hypothetical protein
MSAHHRHPSDRCVDIGSGVCVSPTVHGGNPDVTDSATGEISGGPVEHLAGYIVCYEWPGETDRLRGAITVDPHFDRGWSQTGTLEGGDLTITPSIQAYLDDGTTPSIHGWVRDGKWVSA